MHFQMYPTGPTVLNHHEIALIQRHEQYISVVIIYLKNPHFNFTFEYPCNIYRLLNLYWEIFGTSSYGEGRRMNECRIFHNINSITFLI